jgi:hypothetical protein
MASARIEAQGFQISTYDNDRFMAWLHDVTSVEATELPGDRLDSLTIRTDRGELTTFLPPRVAKAMADAFNKAMAEERAAECRENAA